MTEQEKASALAAKAAEKAKQLEAYVQNLNAQFDACPIEGEACEFSFVEQYLPMPDGAELYMKIYHPEGKDCYPVLIQRSCYPDQMPLYDVYGQQLARRGYGYIVQHCRGTGKSGGTWEPNVNERADGIATLNWLNAQPWAESIGYFGASYLALTGWAIADAVPEKVKGMLLTVYGTDRFTSAYEKGLFRHDVLTGWAMANAGHPVTADYLESGRYRPHAKVDEALWGGKLEWYQDWIHATKRSDAYWQQGWWKQLSEIPSKTKVPVYVVDAWYDHHFGSAMKTWLSLNEETKKHSWLDVGCWNHMSQECIEWGEQKHLENGDIKRVLEWFDLLLKKKQQPEMRIRTYVMREDAWKTLEAWPAPVEKMQRFYLTADSGLAETPQNAGTFTYRYDPHDPCPSHGAESVLTTIQEAGSLLQPRPGYRQDVVTFLSEALQKPLSICGQIRVRIKVATDGDDTAFTAKLCEVFPDGKAYNIRGSITTIAADLPEGVQYTPNTPVDVTVNMWDIAWTVQTGSRLRLDISSSDFPQYAVHSNYAGIWSDQEKTRVACQTLFVGCETSYVELPLSE